MIENMNVFFLLAGFLLFVSVMASSLSKRLGMPLLLLFLAVGMLAGENGIGGLKFSDFTTTSFVGQLALSVILLDGGLRTPWSSFRVALKPSGILATWGVIATVGILGSFAMFYLGLDWKMGLLMAAIVGSTDAAAVFSLLRHSGVKLNERVQSTLEVESGANDPMAILLVTILVESIVMPEKVGWAYVLQTLVGQMVIGFVFGMAGGWVLMKLVSKMRLNEGMYSLLILSGGMLVFSASNLAGGSGFLAVYLAGIVIGNQKLHATEHVLRVMDGLAWLSQAGLFVILGLLVTPAHLLEFIVPSFVIALFLSVIARPLAVLSTLKFFKYTTNEIIFISWVGLRGAVPVTLAIMPVTMGVPNSTILFNVAFAVVIISLSVQGASIPFLARRLKVDVPMTTEPEDTSVLWVSTSVPLQMNAWKVSKDAQIIGKSKNDVPELVGDPASRVVAVNRNKKLVNLNEPFTFEEGDFVWLSMEHELDEKVSELFHESGKKMAEHVQFFGEFNIDPVIKMADLCMVYGIKDIEKEESELSIREFLHKRSGKNLVVGDKIHVGDFILSVKELNDEDDVKTVGLKCP